MLAERTRSYAREAVAEMGQAAPLPDLMIAGARRALTQALAHPADRSAALDLLAGDALVTLALLAQAETAPEDLGTFARTLLRPEHLFS